MEVLDPANTILDELCTRLESATAPWGDDGGDGMLRSSDESEYGVAYAFYSTRVEDARIELGQYFYTEADCWWYGICDTSDTGGAGGTDTCVDTEEDTSDSNESSESEDTESGVDTSPDTVGDTSL